MSEFISGNAGIIRKSDVLCRSVTLEIKETFEEISKSFERIKKEFEGVKE